MSTRFYLASSTAAAVNPTDYTGWLTSTGVTNMSSSNAHFNEALTTTSNYGLDNDENRVSHQFVSRAISGAQTISGNISGQILGAKTSGKGNEITSQLRAIVVSNDGTTLRGELLAVTNGSVFASINLTNLILANAVAISSVNALDGDRIVFQIGGLSGNGENESKTSFNFRIGDNAGSDLPVDDTSTDDYNPWFELSANIVFPSPAPPPSARRRFISA